MEAQGAMVLIVDDNASNLLAMRALLADDHQVLTASSGEEAIAILRARQDVDVILMDVQMPAMDGFEAAKRIRELPDCDEIPIVFVSAVYTEDPSVKRGYEVGGIDYFTKPFDTALLRRKVAVYASFRRRSAFLRYRELQLRESEELHRTGGKLAALLNSFPMGVLIVDAQNRIVRATEPVFGILGISDENAYDELSKWWETGGRALGDALGESPRNERLNFIGPDGSAKTILIAAAPLYPGGRNEAGAAVLIQDVSELQQLEAALERHLSRLVSLAAELEGKRLDVQP